MAEGFIQVTEGIGKKLHAFFRTIGPDEVGDEVVLHGEPYLAGYTAIAPAINLTTQNGVLLQVMAGASLKLRIRYIGVWQFANAGAVTIAGMQVTRLTSAGTGGTVITPDKLDPGDVASGATAMSLPTVAPEFGAQLVRRSFIARAATPAVQELPIFEWVPAANSKGIVVPAGTTNGIGVRLVDAGMTSSTCHVEVLFVETNF